MRLQLAPKKGRKALKPLTTRVPPDWMPVLETARYLAKHDSMQDLVRAVIGEFVATAELDPAVRKTLEIQTQYQQRHKKPILRVADSPGAPEGNT
jgi:hypothetical protein